MPDIEQYYEEYWDDPESYNDPTTPQRQALLKRHVKDVSSDSKVLDVGCGRGEFCRFFAETYGCETLGIDLSKRGIAYAQKQHPDLEFMAVPADALLPDYAGYFDLVFSSEVIEHLFDVGGYLKAIHGLLKPGGSFVLTTPYHGLIKNVLIDLKNYSGHYDPEGQHIRFFDTKGLTGCLRRYGFHVETLTGYGRPWPLWKSFFVVARREDGIGG